MTTMDIIQEAQEAQDNELADKYNELACAPFIITGSENDNSIKRCKKLFI